MVNCLKNIDELCYDLKVYHDLATDEIAPYTEMEAKQLLQHLNDTLELRSNLDKQFFQCIQHLDIDEIIDGYKSSVSYYIRYLIGGYVVNNFDSHYLELLEYAIRKDHRVGYLFLGNLENSLSKSQFIDIVLKALHSRHYRTVSTALAYVQKLKIIEAKKKVLELANNASGKNIKQEAQTAASALQI